MVHELGKTNSVFNHFIAEIRDKEVQKDPIRFRKNMERISEIMGYEISKTFNFVERPIDTPLGEASINLMQEQPVIASILRAGLSMHNGLLNIFDKAENAFISAYRKTTNDNNFDVHVEYLASPDLTNKTLIIADPMLATGTSMKLVYEALLKNGTPSKIHIASVIASASAIEALSNFMPKNTEIWVGAIDQILNDKSYIVPGLGDAGDLAYGIKK